MKCLFSSFAFAYYSETPCIWDICREWAVVGRAAAFPQAAIYLRCKSWLILDACSGRGAEQAAASKLISQQKQHLAFTFLWKTVISRSSV